MYESTLFKATCVSLKGIWRSMWDNEGQDSVAWAYVFQACVPLALWKISENQAHKNLMYILDSLAVYLYFTVILRPLNKCPDYETQWTTITPFLLKYWDVWIVESEKSSFFFSQHLDRVIQIGIGRHCFYQCRCTWSAFREGTVLMLTHPAQSYWKFHKKEYAPIFHYVSFFQ